MRICSRALILGRRRIRASMLNMAQHRNCSNEESLDQVPYNRTLM